MYSRWHADRYLQSIAGPHGHGVGKLAIALLAQDSDPQRGYRRLGKPVFSDGRARSRSLAFPACMMDQDEPRCGGNDDDGRSQGPCETLPRSSQERLQVRGESVCALDNGPRSLPPGAGTYFLQSPGANLAAQGRAIVIALLGAIPHFHQPARTVR